MNERQTDSWTDYWMSKAHAAATRSKDPSFQAGSVLVSADNKFPLAEAYNGPAPQIDDAAFDWNDRDLKRLLVSHAEDNSLWFAAGAYGLEALKGSILYVNGRPCSACMKMMVRAKVTVCVYDDENPSQPKMVDDTEFERTIKLATRGNVYLCPYSCTKGE